MDRTIFVGTESSPPRTDLVFNFPHTFKHSRSVAWDLYNKNEFYWLINGAQGYGREDKSVRSRRIDFACEECRVHGDSLHRDLFYALRDEAQDVGGIQHEAGS